MFVMIECFGNRDYDRNGEVTIHPSLSFYRIDSPIFHNSGTSMLISAVIEFNKGLVTHTNDQFGCLECERSLATPLLCPF